MLKLLASRLRALANRLDPLPAPPASLLDSALLSITGLRFGLIDALLRLPDMPGVPEDMQPAADAARALAHFEIFEEAVFIAMKARDAAAAAKTEALMASDEEPAPWCTDEEYEALEVRMEARRQQLLAYRAQRV